MPSPSPLKRSHSLSASEMRKEKRRIIGSLLKKHNAVIHIEGNVSLLERKLYNVLLLNAYDELGQVRTHSIPTWIMSDMVGYDSNDLEPLQKAIKNLQSSVLEVNLLKDGHQVWESMTLLSWAKIERGLCMYRYDEAVAARLKNPEVYTSINLEVQKRFSSSYALALYENCARFVGVGKTGSFDVDWWRLTLGAHIDPLYRAFKEFNRFCIKPAVAQINERSDIEVEPIFEKDGRSVSRIAFKVRRSPQRLLVGDIDDQVSQLRKSSLYFKMRATGLSDHLCIMYLTHDAQRAEAALHVLEREQTEQGRRIRSPSGYLRAHIDSGVDLSAPAPVVRQQVQALQEEERRQREELARELAQATERSQQLQSLMNSLSVAQLRALNEHYMQWSKPRQYAIGDDGYPSSSSERALFMMWVRSLGVEKITALVRDAAAA